MTTSVAGVRSISTLPNAVEAPAVLYPMLAADSPLVAGANSNTERV